MLYVDVSTRSFKLEKISDPNIYGIIDLGLKVHMDLKSYDSDPLDPSNPLVIGVGPFAGGAVVGSHRLVAVFKSPVSTGLHVSEMGGAGFSFFRTGLDAVVVVGRAGEPLVLRIYGSSDGSVAVDLDELPETELSKIYTGYDGLTGTKALTRYIVDRDKELIAKNKGRVVVVGPAAFRTRFAGIFSYLLDERTLKLTEVSDSASRGGGGSVMAQAHNVVAIEFGGTYRRPNPNLSNVSLLNTLSQGVFKKQYSQALNEKTVKYRFDPSIKTGGTFGVNYPHYKDLVPVLNYSQAYMSKGLRLEVHGKVMENFWKPFQDEVFDGGKLTPASKNCGEPCPVVCKKVYKGVKIDYEPSHAVGPIAGIITVDDSASLVDLLDNLGLDAIEAGHMIAWLFECVNRGLLKPDEIGLEESPIMDPELLSPETSRRNARAARRILELLASDAAPKVLKLIASLGLREAAKELDKIYSDRVNAAGLRFEDLLVYAAFGDSGYFTPNYYWSPGVLAPLYVLGKYWTDYSPAFRDPENYAQVSLRRAIYEYAVANAGFCRFHRGWAEEMLEGMYKLLLGVELNLHEHGLSIYRTIAKYQMMSGSAPVPWESKRVIDAIASLAAESGTPGWEDSMYHREKIIEWWNRFYRRLEEELSRVQPLW